jgi:hypothetical protein
LAQLHTRHAANQADLGEVERAWEGWINVGFGNYHVEFIEDESEFQKLLE